MRRNFFLYNLYPDHEDSESENAESVIYISRQTIRFVRCVYFFMWFSDSFVQFKHNEEEKSQGRSSRSLSFDLRNPSRMTSPFITPLSSPHVQALQSTGGDFDDASTDFSLGEKRESARSRRGLRVRGRTGHE